MVKIDDILERQSLIFIQYRKSYLGITKETERTPGSPWGWLWWLQGNSCYPRELLGRISKGLMKPQWNCKVIPSQGELRRLEHCFPVMVTKFKLSKATLVSTIVALHSIWRLLISLVEFQICKTSIYTLVSNYYVFLEWVGIRLFNNYPVGVWLSTGHLDRHDIPCQDAWYSIMIKQRFYWKGRTERSDLDSTERKMGK